MSIHKGKFANLIPNTQHIFVAAIGAGASVKRTDPAPFVKELCDQEISEDILNWFDEILLIKKILRKYQKVLEIYSLKIES